MPGRGTLVLMLLALLVLAGCGHGEEEKAGQNSTEADLESDVAENVKTIYATQDVYLSMGSDRVLVNNESDELICSVNVSHENPDDRNSTDQNGTRWIENPGCPAIQFDISDLNMTEDDAAVLLLKAESIKTDGEPVMVVLMTIGSDWDESSDYTTFLVNILPAWRIIKERDATAMSSNTDADRIFAFDVSKKLMDARAGGDRISFLLQASSNKSAEISFNSRESEQGPCIVIMPYPSGP